MRIQGSHVAKQTLDALRQHDYGLVCKCIGLDYEKMKADYEGSYTAIATMDNTLHELCTRWGSAESTTKSYSSIWNFYLVIIIIDLNYKIMCLLTYLLNE